MKKSSLPIDANSIHSKKEFTEAYEMYSQRLLWYILKRTEDKKLAEDLVSESFIKAWKGRASFHGGSVQAWLYQIARNVLTDYWRKKKDVSLADYDDVPSENEDVANRLDSEMRLGSLRDAMERLPPTLHAVVTMRFIEGRSAKEVGEVLGISEGNVRVMQYRALRIIRKKLHEK